MKGATQHNSRGVGSSAAKFAGKSGKREHDSVNERWFGGVSWRKGIREINAAFEALKARKPGIYE